MKIKISLALAALVWSTQVFAVPVIVLDSVLGDKVAGVDGLNVGSTVWNVRFNDGSYDDNYPTDAFPFANPLDASTAVTALTAFINTTTYASEPSSFIGCHTAGAISSCDLSTPYFVNRDASVGPLLVSSWSSVVGLTNTVTLDTLAFDLFLDYDNISWATWTTAAPTPEPGMLTLLVIGIAGVAGLSRTKRRV